MTPPRLAAVAALLATLAPAPPAAAHPHVFVDARVDFVFGEGEERVLEALAVTWRFDAFETLYTLSAEGLAPDAEGRLDEAARRRLARQFTDWPAEFDGFARLSVEGRAVALDAPRAAAAALVDGRLEVRFTRPLPTPIALDARGAEVAVYEATYYYAVSVAEAPSLVGTASGCTARVRPFEPDAGLAAVQTSLFELGREETPAVADVGALFADRVVLACD